MKHGWAAEDRMSHKGRTLVAYSGGPDAAALYLKLIQIGASPIPVYINYRKFARGGKVSRDLQHVHASLDVLGHAGRLVEIRAPLGNRDKAERNRFFMEQLTAISPQYKAYSIAIGTLNEPDFEDVNADALQKHATLRHVYTWDEFNVETKAQQFQELSHDKAEEMIQATWSCQLWYKKHCGRCYSCKERHAAFGIAYGRDRTAYIHQPKPLECA